MKMMKVSKIIMTGVMIAALTGGMAATVKAANVQTGISVEHEINGFIGNVSDMNFDMISYIKGMKFLSDNEKQKLLTDEQKIEEKYKEIDKVSIQIEEISSNILQGSDQLYDEINKVYERHSELWDKLYDNVTEEQNLLPDMESFIQVSNSLSEEEKAILLADENDVKEIEVKLGLKYDEVEKAIADLAGEESRMYAEIDDIDKENESIWSKVWANQSEEDSVPILY